MFISNFKNDSTVFPQYPSTAQQHAIYNVISAALLCDRVTDIVNLVSALPEF